MEGRGWAGERSGNGLQLKMVLAPKSQMRAFIYAEEDDSSVHRSCLSLECRHATPTPRDSLAKSGIGRGGER